MSKFPIIILLTIFVVYGCRNNSGETDQIEYEVLDEIRAEVTLEIGESDEYFPGQLRDLIHTSDGTLLVSDWGKTTIEQFNTDGEHVATIAKEGRGPGELTSFFLLFKGINDALIVRHRGMNNQIDVYQRKNEKGAYQHIRSKVIEQSNDRYITFVNPVSDSTYLAYAKVNTPFLQMQQQIPAYSFAPVAVVDESESILVDSLHILKAPNPVTDITNRGINVIGMPPYQYQDRLRIMNDGVYLIARPDSSALYTYDRFHNLKEQVLLNIKPRPVNRQDLDHSLKNVDNLNRSRLEERVGNVKPPFLNIWTSNDYFLLHTDTREEGKEMVVLTMSGEPVGKFYLSEFDEVKYFINDSIYTLNKDPENGHTIRIYQLHI